MTSGPGRIIVALYAIFAIAASSRAAVQIATDWSDAPIAYALSGFSAAIYLLATLFMIKAGARSHSTFHRLARAMMWIELVGVVLIGTASVLFSSRFPRATVWSGYGMGYGFVPLILPVVGLWWASRSAASSGVAEATT
jgi:hypothetical protein